MEIKIVTGPCCPKCMQLKMILGKKGILYEEIPGDSAEGKALMEQSDLQSFPVVSKDGEFMAGNDALGWAMKL